MRLRKHLYVTNQVVYFANTCGAKSGDKSWATMLASDEAMDLVFGSGGDAILDDDDEVTHRPLKEPVTEAEDARRLLQLLALRGLGVGCARFIAPAAGEVQAPGTPSPAAATWSGRRRQPAAR